MMHQLAFHGRIRLEDVLYFVAPVVTCRKLMGRPHAHSFKHWCASEYHFQEIKLMILPVEAFDVHFFKIDQGDIFASPVLGLITETMYLAFSFHLEQKWITKMYLACFFVLFQQAP
jgi:hypothetical protein